MSKESPEVQELFDRILACLPLAVKLKLRFRLDELTREDWHAIQNGGDESWTQAIGRGCRLAGFEGVIAPSARYRGGKTVVAFPDNLGKGSSIELMLKEELPPHPSDWPKKDV